MRGVKSHFPLALALLEHGNSMVSIPTASVSEDYGTGSPGDLLTICLKHLVSVPTRHHNTKYMLNKCMVFSLGGDKIAYVCVCGLNDAAFTSLPPSVSWL